MERLPPLPMLPRPGVGREFSLSHSVLNALSSLRCGSGGSGGSCTRPAGSCPRCGASESRTAIRVGLSLVLLPFVSIDLSEGH